MKKKTKKVPQIRKVVVFFDEGSAFELVGDDARAWLEHVRKATADAHVPFGWRRLQRLG